MRLMLMASGIRGLGALLLLASVACDDGADRSAGTDVAFVIDATATAVSHAGLSTTSSTTTAASLNAVVVNTARFRCGTSDGGYVEATITAEQSRRVVLEVRTAGTSYRSEPVRLHPGAANVLGVDATSTAQMSAELFVGDPTTSQVLAKASNLLPMRPDETCG